MIRNSLILRNVTFSPALFCAPMSEITHSAFRRLLADFGGYGALFTEMLSARALLKEDPATSPYVKKRPEEGRVIYQILVNGSEPLAAIADRLMAFGADGIDVNGACPSPSIKALRAGAFLFEDEERLAQVLRTLRRCYPGPLTVKIRLGRQRPDWQAQLSRRLKLMEDCGVDALTLHPRFQEEKLKRSARHDLFPWVAAQTRLPVIANGDITGAAILQANPGYFEPTAGIMLGRIAAVQPWVFAQWHQSEPVDYAEVWTRLFRYACEDFTPQKAVFRIKIFTAYYARNFSFGHTLFTQVHNAKTLETIYDTARRFLSAAPQLVPAPSTSGV
ncbi:MAG: tRNA-dihydrouridine synthase family protein [Verrucomicrobia bacterium]|nr:tRNA-dihydrouridine synthase family protein [Verrucomicrobiota bacterium]MBU4290862.1 tRNA-dihydrouridine synthase family protein [Verrucomicrobiota bacterium]MBU4429705.1 tRNA-dihydrouridine synthase family protein [Verrucomicrobiota bacterium]MBU4497802.1 tRNA-dihydrouridine synthase family protein [Verrucomicrobiota bacterium]MCG2680611.1 tRNA-dihydrouridine synthase family protein [Kiritimatiellia bacterium]